MRRLAMKPDFMVCAESKHCDLKVASKRGDGLLVPVEELPSNANRWHALAKPNTHIKKI